jgi:hypothetical protein
LGEAIATGDTSICSIWWSLCFTRGKYFSFSEVGQWVTSEQYFSFKTVFFGIIERKKKHIQKEESMERIYIEDSYTSVPPKIFRSYISIIYGPIFVKF